MGATYGQKSQFTATDGNLRLNIEDLVKRYEDYKFPVLKRWNSKIFEKEVLSYKYDWKERDLRAKATTLVDATVDTSTTSFIVNAGGVFNKDDVLYNIRTQERMLVKAVQGGVNVEVSRGYQGSTPTAMVAGDTLVRLSVNAAQGALVDDGVTYDPDELYNFTTIYEDSAFLTDSQHKGFVHGDETKTDWLERIQQEQMENLQLDLFMGLRYRDIANKRSSVGGMKNFVDLYAPENAINFGGAGTWGSDTGALGKIEDAVQQIAEKMGDKPTIYGTYRALRKVRFIQDDLLRTNRGDSTRGIGVVNQIDSGMGKLDVVQLIDRTHILDDFLFFADEKKVGYKAHKGRGWFTEEKPYAGDGHSWQVIGEYTAKFETPKASLAYIHNLGVNG